MDITHKPPHQKQQRSGYVSFLLGLWRDKRSREIFYQLLLIALVIFSVWYLASNAVRNLAELGVPLSFDFLSRTSSYDITQTLIPYNSESTHGRAAIVGMLNTIVLAITGIFAATLIGLFAGIARLSQNFLLSRIAHIYVEAMRNVPLLIHILLWQGIMFSLPNVRNALVIVEGFVLTNRGLIMPTPLVQPEFWFLIPILALITFFIIWRKRYAKALQQNTGEQIKVLLPSVIAIFSSVILTFFVLYFLTGRPFISFDFPKMGRFNFSGGSVIRTEFIAMFMALTLYTGAFIAEVVRSGILAINQGQWEASLALGLKRSFMMRLVVLPQALRVIIPPLTNQYLNLTKNSSLGIAIGYAEITATLGGITLNQTGRALECVGLLLLFYLSLSILTSVVMNWFNKKTALITR